jgi:hypothetical protein
VVDHSDTLPFAAPPITALDELFGLDGIAVERLLQGAVLKGCDPEELLRKAGIDPSVHGNVDRSIDGRALSRLIQQIQLALDDAFIGFMAERCRLALDLERMLAYLHCETFGESIRVSTASPRHCRKISARS